MTFVNRIIFLFLSLWDSILRTIRCLLPKVKKDKDRNGQKKEQEKLRLLSVFPAEVWTIIIKKIELMDDPIDQWACCQASAFFEDYLEKTSFLFPMVLKVLNKTQHLTPKDTHTILTCRLVCPKWKKATNALLEKQPKRHIFVDLCRSNHFGDMPPSPHFCPSNFCLDQLLNEILPLTGSTAFQTTNPFPSRYLTINEKQILEAAYQQTHDEDEDWALETLSVYRAVTLQLLEQVGHFFWYANLSLENVPFENWTSRIIQLIQLLPNVKRLYIKNLSQNYNPSQNHPTLEEEFDLLSVARARGLANRLLDLELNFLFTECRLIKSVQLHVCYSRQEKQPHIMAHSPIIRKVETLSVTLQSAQGLQLVSNSWKLRVIRLTFQTREKCKSWVTIFQKLAFYKETLKKLYIDFPTAEEQLSIWEASSTGLCKWSKASTAQGFVGEESSREFLLGVELLENLNITFPPSLNPPLVQKRDERVIEYENSLFSKILQRANVWELLPNLDKVVWKCGHSIRKYRRNSC